MIEIVIFTVIAYLLGSIPTAVWVGKKWYGKDVREHGSKNAGATNTFRVLGKKPGVWVLVIDVAKGAVAAFLPYIWFVARLDSPNMTYLLFSVQICASIAAVLGHLFPLFAGFRGGKGVATSLGVIIGIQPIAAAICLGIFLAVFIAFRYVSLGAMVAAASFPMVVRFVLGIEVLIMDIFGCTLALVVILAHRKNITRLLNGEESKMNLFKK